MDGLSAPIVKTVNVCCTFLLQVGATKVVFAYHSEDPVSQTEMKHHEFRGAKTILLLNSMDKRNINETGWTKYTVTMKNVRNSNAFLIRGAVI